MADVPDHILAEASRRIQAQVVYAQRSQFSKNALSHSANRNAATNALIALLVEIEGKSGG